MSSDSSFNNHNALYFVKYPSRAEKNLLEGRGLKTPALSLTRAFTPGGTQFLSFINSYYVVSITLTPWDPDHLSFITTDYPGLHRLKRILREGVHILSSDPSIQDFITHATVTFWKPHNLCKLIADTNLHPPEAPDLAIDLDVRRVTFTIPPTPSPAPALTRH